MSDKMPHMVITAQDLADYQNYVVGSSLEALRMSQLRVNRDLILQNKLLVSYTSEAHMIISKALNNLSLLDVETRFTPDVLESNLAFSHVSATPALPHQNFGFNKSQLSQRLEGMSDRDAELNRVNYNKQMCLSRIRKLTRLKTMIDSQLESNS